MNKLLERALESHEEQDEPIAKETIKYAEKLLDSFFRTGAPVQNVSTGVGGRIYLLWSSGHCLGQVSIGCDGTANFYYVFKKEPPIAGSWKIGQKIPDDFYKGQKIMASDV